MKKIQYKFITEEVVEVEVDDTIGAVIEAMNDEDENINRAETRRHKSLDTLESCGTQFTASDDVITAVEQFLAHERLYRALAELSPEQRRLLHMVYSEGRSLADIAREEGVKYQAIQNRMRRITAKLTNLL